MSAWYCARKWKASTARDVLNGISENRRIYSCWQIRRLARGFGMPYDLPAAAVPSRRIRLATPWNWCRQFQAFAHGVSFARDSSLMTRMLAPWFLALVSCVLVIVAEGHIARCSPLSDAKKEVEDLPLLPHIAASAISGASHAPTTITVRLHVLPGSGMMKSRRGVRARQA